LFEGGELYEYLYLHGLSVETCEALAELHHKTMREELGIADEDAAAIREFVSPEVSWGRGIRLAIRRAESGGSDEVVYSARAGAECGSAADFGVFAGAGAEYVGAVVHHPGAKYLWCEGKHFTTEATETQRKPTTTWEVSALTWLLFFPNRERRNGIVFCMIRKLRSGEFVCIAQERREDWETEESGNVSSRAAAQKA